MSLHKVYIAPQDTLISMFGKRWKKIYNLPENAHFRKVHPDPNIITKRHFLYSPILPRKRKWAIIEFISYPTREQFIENVYPHNGVIAEIGVYYGDNAENINKITSPRELHLIDCWEEQPIEEYGDLVAAGQAVNDERYDIVKNKFEGQNHVKIHRMFSTEAVEMFDDEYFDLVYIDANHSYQTCMQDLEMWYPKVKPGQIIAGHDLFTGDKRHDGVRQAVFEFLGKYKLKLMAMSIFWDYAIRKE